MPCTRAIPLTIREIVVYGRNFGTGIKDPDDLGTRLQASLTHGELKIRLEQGTLSRVSLIGLNGQRIFTEDTSPDAPLANHPRACKRGVHDRSPGRQSDYPTKLINE